MNLLTTYLAILLSFLSTLLVGQDTTSTPQGASDTLSQLDKYVLFFSESDPFQAKEEAPEEKGKPKKKPKKKKKVFYGIKTRRGWIVDGSGSKQTITKFHYLKTDEKKARYAPKIYWYNIKDRKIVNKIGRRADPAMFKLLHGRYEVTRGGKVIEKGMFYFGAKDGRWERFGSEKEFNFHRDDDNDTTIAWQSILNKEYFTKGWPKDSKFTYWDAARTKLKEVVPMVDGDKHGQYVQYFKTGKKAVSGYYKYDEKVGVWTFYRVGDRKRIVRWKTIQFKKDPFDKTFRPYILREYNTLGKPTYEHKKRSKEYKYYDEEG